ncbi:MAG: hypothetical protein LBV35_15980 [Acinetobacter sp.]|jgi:hypothetical protein|uniref:hypothetical protein n=1 Tax=Acinetobacter sp. TaxID=472 RepID=UPI0028408E0A|nr:hypothetical protein [Acinetobacter sp.]MDR3029936.1 hypothetical protein [Acinetobacter sp.]
MKINILILNIFAIMFVVLIFIMALTFIIFHFQDASTSLKDAWSTTASFFGGFATLTAAYIGSKLFNDWKEEKKYELENNLLTKILSEIKPIYVELLRIRSDSNNLKSININLIVKTDYISKNNLDLFSSTLSFFPSIKAYCTIKNDDELLKLYDKFDAHCYCFISFYKILFLNKYRTYYYKYMHTNNALGLPSLEHYDIFRPYPDKRKEDLAIDIEEVLQVFKTNALEAVIGDNSTLTTYDEWLNETIEHLQEIEDLCIDRLKVPD